MNPSITFKIIVKENGSFILNVVRQKKVKSISLLLRKSQKNVKLVKKELATNFVFKYANEGTRDIITFRRSSTHDRRPLNYSEYVHIGSLTVAVVVVATAVVVVNEYIFGACFYF